MGKANFSHLASQNILIIIVFIIFIFIVNLHLTVLVEVSKLLYLLLVLVQLFADRCTIPDLSGITQSYKNQ